MARPTLTVSITPEIESELERLLAAGMYGNQSEIVRAGLRLLFEKEHARTARLELEEAINKGIRSGRNEGTVALDVEKVLSDLQASET